MIDSNAANVTSLAAGTVLARVLLSTDKGSTLTHLLRLGRDSDDWALWRGDLRYRLGRVKARSWLHWASAGQFFASSYRSYWVVPSSPDTRFVRIAILRSPHLPADVTISVSFVGAER